MYLVTLDTLTASHSSHEQYVDPAGVAWICTGLEGWRRAPGRRTTHSERPTADGAHRSAAYRGTRSLEVAGRLFAPTPEVGELSADTLLALCPDPGERYPLTVQGRDGRTLVAYVEQAGEILCDQTGPAIWDWSVPLIAADPYRYDQAWVSPTGAGGDPGSGGIDFSGAGASFASPGLAMGAAPKPIEAIVRGTGTADSLLVFEITGPTAGVQIIDTSSPSVVGVRGEIPAGMSLYVNTTGRTAFDVPDCPVPIPAFGAVVGGASARGAVWVTGGWPRLGPGQQRTFQMIGSTDVGSSLTVHTRAAWV